MNQEFGNSAPILGSFATSIYVLGLAVGPLVLSPLSEIYGRRVVLDGANMWLTIWQIGCALSPNLGSLIAFRFLAGAGGSASMTIGGAVISDLFAITERGFANSIFTIGPLFGPVMGPILGGLIAQRAGWRWTFWVLLAACGTATAGVKVFNRETNAVVLLRWKAQRLAKVHRRGFVSHYDATGSTDGVSPGKQRSSLLRGIIMPLRLMFTSPIVPLLAGYMSFVFGLLYLLLTTVTNVFRETYQWDLEICGLAYLGLGLGFTLGLIIVARTSDAALVRLTYANGGVYQPEMRLSSCVVFASFVPISFFWYGRAADKTTHWVVPILGFAPFGFGMMGIFAPIQTYMIDIGGRYTASILACLTTTRCIFGCFLPLAGPSMYASLGLGWGNSVLGFIGLALIPAPLLIYRLGGKLRERSPLSDK